MKRRIIALLCAGCLFSLTACQEDIEITEVPMPPVEEEPEPTPDDTDKIYECEHPLLLTEQAQGRILIVDADTRETLWEWRAASAADMPDATSLMRLPSEVKAIYNRRYILATASGGGVAIIRIADKKVMFYASAGNNPHSAEVFPDGNLVVASTDNDGFLSTFRVDTVARTGQVVQKLPLTFCHSAVWDRSRGRLLATSDNKLCVFTYNGDGNRSPYHEGVRNLDSRRQLGPRPLPRLRRKRPVAHEQRLRDESLGLRSVDGDGRLFAVGHQIGQFGAGGFPHRPADSQSGRMVEHEGHRHGRAHGLRAERPCRSTRRAGSSTTHTATLQNMISYNPQNNRHP